LDTGERTIGDEATWDLWFNQPIHPFPGFNLESCYDQATERLDRGCWQAMLDRADRETWDDSVADVVCVPTSEEATCRHGVVRLVMDPDFEGSRRPGVYHFALWVNRFSTIPEWDEFDNFAGPIRVTVEPTEDDVGHVAKTPDGRAVEETAEPSAGGVSGAASSIITNPSRPAPYGTVIVPEEMNSSFSVTSMRSQRLVEFNPAYAGEVSVEVSQTGMYENMTVQVRKVSTGEVLVEAQGKGRLLLEGALDGFRLKDDQTFEVVVVPGQGSRGIRGTIRVSYPARLRYMVAP
jgi:hypothetical protein